MMMRLGFASLSSIHPPPLVRHLQSLIEIIHQFKTVIRIRSQGRIVGFIVAEIKTRVRCNKEDQDILSPSYPLSTPIAYILSLGVLCPFRCQGVGSLLLDNLLNHLTSKDHHTCKAVFLHVLW